MLKIAILGASGFIGTRAVEMLHLGELAEVRPVVRSFANLARLSKFDLDWRLADAVDEKALTRALQGCDLAVHCVAGDTSVIMGSIVPFYKAAQANNISRIIYLSSAAVHGQAPAAGTDENSPLSDHQPVVYNNARVKAEQRLMALRSNGAVEVVILRPGIVMGPRSSRWLVAIAHDLLNGKAYLIDGGQGICNSIYVDNLVHAIHLAMTADTKAVDGEAFLIADKENVTWLEVYAPIASALGIDPADIARVVSPTFTRSWQDTWNDVRASNLVQAVLPLFPGRLKRGIKAALTEMARPAAAEKIGPSVDGGVGLDLSLEMCLLQSCKYKLPYTKAQHKLGYEPIVSYLEGMRRSIAWLSFASYPVVAAGGCCK
jgi:nucleoside-diphosphate-sugar epimerase